MSYEVTQLEKLSDLKRVLPLMEINETKIKYNSIPMNIISLFGSQPENDNMFFFIVKIACEKIPEWFFTKYSDGCNRKIWEKYVNKKIENKSVNM